MSSPRLAEDWLKDDKQEKKDILKRLYFKLTEIHSLEPFKGSIVFLVDCSKGRVSNESVSKIFEDAAKHRISPDEFERYFNYLAPLEAKILSYNLSKKDPKQLDPPRSWQGQNIALTEIDQFDLDRLRQYLHNSDILDSDILASLSVGNAESKSLFLPEDSPPYAIHSVAKIFTGVLLLIMLEEKIVTEDMLEKPIYDGIISEEALKLLPDRIQAHLKEKKITLLQLMLHESGIGDYGYDKDTGSLRATIEKKQPIDHDLTDIKNFLRYAEDKVYGEGHWHYSNLGLTMVGLAIEHAYKNMHPDKPLRFNEILKEYIIDLARMECFSATRPENGIYNPADTVAKDWVGGPAGGYWTTTKDLVKFGEWLFGKCKDNHFKSLIEKYGKEFYHEGRIEHPGESPSSSAFFSVSLSTGNIVSILSAQRGIATTLGLELVMGHKIFKPLIENQDQLSTTAMISIATGVPPSAPVIQPDKELSQSSSAATKSSGLEDHLVDSKSDDETHKPPSSLPTPKSNPK